jgi:hypothetical protein
LKKKTVVYVLGLGHSGSTILEYLVCQNSRALGLGEVYKLTGKWALASRLRDCSCGENVESCEVWDQMGLRQAESKKDWYKRLEKHLREKFPEKYLWVDTSKSIREFTNWQVLAERDQNLDLKIIYLVRDVRGWVWSDVGVRKRKNRRQRSLGITMIFWYIQQLRFRKALRVSRLQSYTVSYESLVFEQQQEMANIFRFLDMKPKNEMGVMKPDLTKGFVHDVTGNRMKSDLKSSTPIKYDFAWTKNPQIKWWFTVLLPIRRYMQDLYKASNFIQDIEGYNLAKDRKK